MRSARQALTDLAALCDDWATFAPGWVESTRAILADVEPEPAFVWDRDAALGVVVAWDHGSLIPLLDALEGCVRPAPAHTIDRDALGHVLYEAWLHEPSDRRPTTKEWEHLKDSVLALLRPVGGVTLTREEAAQARLLVEDILRRAQPTSDWGLRASALAARLETAP